MNIDGSTSGYNTTANLTCLNNAGSGEYGQIKFRPLNSDPSFNNQILSTLSLEAGGDGYSTSLIIDSRHNFMKMESYGGNILGYIYPQGDYALSSTSLSIDLQPNCTYRSTGYLTAATVRLNPSPTDSDSIWFPGCVTTIVLSKGNFTPTFTSVDAQYKIYYADGYNDVTLSGSAKDKMVYCVMFDGSGFYINRQLYMS